MNSPEQQTEMRMNSPEQPIEMRIRFEFCWLRMSEHDILLICGGGCCTIHTNDALSSSPHCMVTEESKYN